ncbi:hypothetical protein RUM44_010939 [Polyplax serrata]|uniref:Uncharacterized protein n=1 Tax=Polyplax serrata TaxID=468196 RepID=A0ABR1ANN7_POLSC
MFEATKKDRDDFLRARSNESKQMIQLQNFVPKLFIKLVERQADEDISLRFHLLGKISPALNYNV